MRKNGKRAVAWGLALALLPMGGISALAEESPLAETPALMEAGTAPGGMSEKPKAYSAVYTVTKETDLSGEEIASAGADENAIHVDGGELTLAGAAVTRISEESTGGDGASLYGVGAAVLVTDGSAQISGGTIETDASGGAGVFAYGDGVVSVTGTQIITKQDTSGGLHAAGGGTLYARDVTVETAGESSAAICSDRGGGTMVIDGGTYVARGSGSPAVYVMADVTIREAALAALSAEALCLEGMNTVRLYDCDLIGNMQNLDFDDSTWTVVLYQSMSGDSQIGEGRFEMSGGTITSSNGGLFYTTNTQSEFVLSHVAISAAENCEYLLRCTGNENGRGWGTAGENGASCTFTGIGQTMAGDIIWDSISKLNVYLTENSTLTGAVIDDERCARDGADGFCHMTIDEGSVWVVTGDSVLTSLSCAGQIVDPAGNSVSIVGPEGVVLVEGESPFRVRVENYSSLCDLSGAGVLSAWEEHAGALL